MAESIVNENATCWVTVRSFDREGAPASPGTFTWDVHDGIDGTALSTGNSETPSSSVTITVPKQYNAIRHGRAYERRIVTATEGFGGGERITGEARYLIKNLGLVLSTASTST